MRGARGRGNAENGAFARSEGQKCADGARKLPERPYFIFLGTGIIFLMFLKHMVLRCPSVGVGAVAVKSQRAGLAPSGPIQPQDFTATAHLRGSRTAPLFAHLVLSSARGGGALGDGLAG